MYPMTDPRRKSLRGAPWDGPSLTCYKKRSPNMGTKTGVPCRFFNSSHIKKDPQTWGRKLDVHDHIHFFFVDKKRSPNMGTKTRDNW